MGCGSELVRDLMRRCAPAWSVKAEKDRGSLTGLRETKAKNEASPRLMAIHFWVRCPLRLFILRVFIALENLSSYGVRMLGACTTW